MKSKIRQTIKAKLLDFLIPTGFYIKQKGVCPICKKEVEFTSQNSWLRDNLICPCCFSIPRERALMMTIDKYYPDWKDLDIHESSPAGRGASLKLKSECRKYLATQYYPNHIFGAQVDQFQNEDLENQTFPDNSFDLVITQDVMEHIYNPEKTFAEIARTLKKGGAHIFTVPIINKHKKTELWAVKGEDGNPTFKKTPEYHGNPVDPKGSPVTFHWGYDIVDFIKTTSKLETEIEYINDLKYGISAEYIEVLVSKK